jgi:hypothetical protein
MRLTIFALYGLRVIVVAQNNRHIQNIRAFLPILGFLEETLSLKKSFACSGLDASAVRAINPIPNLELQSSQIGTFFGPEHDR